MPEPAHAPGWYPDPHRQAELRWHDGTTWTEHLHGDSDAPPALTAVPASVPRTSGMAIASLVLALLGFGLVAVVFGAIALRQIGRSAGQLTGRGLAIAGIVVGVVWGFLMLAILLAVAVPTFLAQKDTALETQARANVKQVQIAVESCAAGNTDGSYTGCGAARIAEDESMLAPLLARCGSAGGACVTITEGGVGYHVSAASPGLGSDLTEYVEDHRADGAIARTCSGSGCPDGTW